jgi:hypothetical protein
MSEYSLQQDLYEDDETFEFRVTIFKLLLNKFPSILPDQINVLTSAYIKKLKTGEVFTVEIEKMLKWGKLNIR